MTTEFSATPVFSAWPFWVLEIDPTADNRAIEKAYQKLVNSLQLKIANTEQFMTPLGLRVRDEFMLREARAVLTDPDKRVLAEFWYMPAEQLAVQAKPDLVNEQPINWHSVLKAY
ncbi:MAG TPA: hypothetical protein VIZ65_15185 [Cellvibrionaceae bacterium]